MTKSFSDTMRSNSPDKARIMSDVYDKGLEKQKKLTQNDWESQLSKSLKSMGLGMSGSQAEWIFDFVREQRADARREVISRLEKVQSENQDKDIEDYCYAMDKVLATLRKEEKKDYSFITGVEFDDEDTIHDELDC